jgi:hypothetical protein
MRRQQQIEPADSGVDVLAAEFISGIIERARVGREFLRIRKNLANVPAAGRCEAQDLELERDYRVCAQHGEVREPPLSTAALTFGSALRSFATGYSATAQLRRTAQIDKSVPSRLAQSTER